MTSAPTKMISRTQMGKVAIFTIRHLKLAGFSTPRVPAAFNLPQNQSALAISKPPKNAAVANQRRILKRRKLRKRSFAVITSLLVEAEELASFTRGQTLFHKTLHLINPSLIPLRFIMVR